MVYDSIQYVLYDVIQYVLYDVICVHNPTYAYRLLRKLYCYPSIEYAVQRLHILHYITHSSILLLQLLLAVGGGHVVF